MTYTVKELYYTLQGEGARAGRPAVFVRFAGCNLWSGREADRAGATCPFCDQDILGTDGPGGGKFASAEALAEAVAAAWPGPQAGRPAQADGGAQAGGVPYAVCTGGEPLLQLDAALVEALHARGFEVAIETNGTRPAQPGIDWITVSPKRARADGAALVLVRGDELKLVYPQADVDPARFLDLDFTHFYLQPLDDAERERHTREAIDYVLAHPRWRLSLQTHKYLGLR